jgi:hypothetical protein
LMLWHLKLQPLLVHSERLFVSASVLSWYFG